MGKLKSIIVAFSAFIFSCSNYSSMNQAESLCMRDVPCAKLIFETCSESRYFCTHFLETYPDGYVAFNVKGVWGAYIITLQCDAYLSKTEDKIDRHQNWIIYVAKVESRGHLRGSSSPPSISYDVNKQYKFTNPKDFQDFIKSTERGEMPPVEEHD